MNFHCTLNDLVFGGTEIFFIATVLVIRQFYSPPWAFPLLLFGICFFMVFKEWCYVELFLHKFTGMTRELLLSKIFINLIVSKSRTKILIAFQEAYFQTFFSWRIWRNPQFLQSTQTSLIFVNININSISSQTCWTFPIMNFALTASFDFWRGVYVLRHVWGGGDERVRGEVTSCTREGT